MDSPLSTTANITGILTFAAAIVFFIYARFQIIKTGREEFVSILSSVEPSIYEAGRLMNFGHSDRVVSSQIEILTRELWSVEKRIMALLDEIRGYGITQFPPFEDVFRTTALPEEPTVGIPDPPALDVRGGMPRFKLLYIVLRISSLISLWILSRGFFIGSPRTWRWYRDREKVLELTRKREGLRSKLLLYMLCALDR